MREDIYPELRHAVHVSILIPNLAPLFGYEERLLHDLIKQGYAVLWHGIDQLSPQEREILELTKEMWSPH